MVTEGATGRPAGRGHPAARAAAPARPKSLAVAGISARAMAEAAVRDGFEVVALDLFGDADTCRAAARWLPLAEPGATRFDADCTLAALRVLAQRGDVAGWVPGSGFEAMPEVLGEGAAWLPLIGNPPEVIRRVRDPRGFFRTLQQLALPHPPVLHAAPADPAGWLLKDLQGCGGWQVQPAPAGRVPGSAAAPGQLWQRFVAGRPMSATFIADGRRAVVLGFNLQLIEPIGDRPWVFAGVVGPVALPAPAAVKLHAAVDALVAAFGLRGLGSLDFVYDEVCERWWLLELNPRPPASLACYPEAAPMAGHVRACLHGELPPVPPAPRRVEGQRIVFAPRALRLGADTAARIADRADTHDLPSAGTAFAAGEPVCSLGACGDAPADVLARLAHAHAQLIALLENEP